MRHAIADAVHDQDLLTLGRACRDLALLTGGSGLALGLPENFRARGLLATDATAAAELPSVGGAGLVISGSCSAATLGQVRAMQRERPSFAVKPEALAEHAAEVQAEAVAWAEQNLRDSGSPVLIYASAEPEQVRQAQRLLGRERAGALVEQTLAAIAKTLVDGGVRRLVVAGGETSGAVVQSLGVRMLQIGPQIDPGVPWTVVPGERPLALALKSGNFGGEDFFSKALACAP